MNSSPLHSLLQSLLWLGGPRVGMTTETERSSACQSGDFTESRKSHIGLVYPSVRPFDGRSQPYNLEPRHHTWDGRTPHYSYVDLLTALKKQR